MKNKIISITFVSYLCLMFILNVITPDKNISISERRKLSSLPKATISNVLNKNFMEEFDSYVSDQFIFRNTYRNIKANINYNVFKKLDNNKIYLYKDHTFKSEYPTNKKSIENFISKINAITSNLTENNNVYYSIIPDKNYYLDTNKYLNIDYDYLYNQIININLNYIELRDVLTLDDYYKTDIHWKQENLYKVVERLSDYLNYTPSYNYTKKTYDKFYGSYYGQSALNLKPDTITYLIDENILNSEVYYLEDNNNQNVYIEEKLTGLDSYDVFLSGPSSYIEISKKISQNDKELIIFRDSFSSSLAPLLIPYYKKITLIDTRYINSDNYLKYLTFDNQDILILYSTLLVNNSYTLK